MNAGMGGGAKDGLRLGEASAWVLRSSGISDQLVATQRVNPEYILEIRGFIFAMCAIQTSPFERVRHRWCAGLEKSSGRI